jgi:hypothetical protein
MHDDRGEEAAMCVGTNVRNDPPKKERETPKKPEPIRLSDPGHTPGSAEGERESMKEALGERPSLPTPPPG